MSFAGVLAHVRFQYYRHGWPGALGLALLVAAIGVQILAVPALKTQTDLARTTQERLRKRATQAPAQQDTILANNAALLASLPAAANTSSDTVKTMHRLAAAHGVRLATGEYRLVRESGEKVLRYQITLPASASYPILRAWLADVMNEIPALALDEMSFRREDASSEKIDARFRFTLFIAKA